MTSENVLIRWISELLNTRRIQAEKLTFLTEGLIEASIELGSPYCLEVRP